MPIQLPKRNITPIGSKYELLGLRDMPFPSDGFVDPYSTDPRTNGSIYAVSTAQSAIAKFEDLLIRPNDFPNRVRLAYLWSKGDSESGRGVGKTALLRYFRHRINSDWGLTEFNGQFSAVVIYVGFRSQVDRRHMEQLAASALVDVCKNGVLDASRAALRRDAIPEDEVAAILTDETKGIADADNLLDDQVLQKYGVDSADIDEKVASTLISAGIEVRVAQASLRMACSRTICDRCGRTGRWNRCTSLTKLGSSTTPEHFYSTASSDICARLDLAADTCLSTT
jgi:hypothetical protein